MKTFPIKLTDKEHQLIREEAFFRNISIQKLIKHALEMYFIHKITTRKRQNNTKQ